MNDMTPIIAPKSNQLTSDDLLAGDKIITINDVAITPGTEQPCQIRYDGDQGKPWFPCKTMARVLVKAWGPDAKQYIGKAVQLYRDPSVTWAGMAVGGIRIRALSHIDAAFDMALTATRGKKAMARFLPLKAEVKRMPAQQMTARQWATDYIDGVNNCRDTDALNTFANERAAKLAELESKRPELHLECVHALDNKRAALSFEPEGNPAADMGEPFTDDGMFAGEDPDA